MLSPRWVFSLALLALACGGANRPVDGAECAAGNEPCACDGKSPCGPGLECRTGFCVDSTDDPPHTGGAGGSGGTDGISLAGTSGTAGAGDDDDDDGWCKPVSYVTELIALDMFVLMDRSGSMTGTRWEAVTLALSEFVEDATSADFGVGLGFFPPALPDPCPDDAQCERDICDAAGYATPDVAFQSLPGGAVAVQETLASTSPGGLTPTAPALAGAIQYAEANVDRLTTVVLVTDGLPEGCAGSDSVGAVAQVAASGLTSGVQTFVIGIGDELVSLKKSRWPAGPAPPSS